jgi:hypothetical protein
MTPSSPALCAQPDRHPKYAFDLQRYYRFVTKGLQSENAGCQKYQDCFDKTGTYQSA